MRSCTAVLEITAIITTHNRMNTLPRAIQSILQQTRSADEIIIVDDGSTDNTSGRIQQEFPGIQYLRQPNLGISAARNLAVKHAKGQWLAFLDDDDCWLPGKLHSQLELATRYPDHRLCHTEEIWMRHGKRVNPMNKHRKSGGRIYPNCLPRCVISPSSVMIRRDLFIDTGLFDETLPACEDYDLWLRVCAREPVLFVKTPQIIKYGGHPDQLSRRYPAMDQYRIQALENILQEKLLSDENRQLTLDMLIRKITILMNGAHKRNKQKQAAFYQQKLLQYQAPTLRKQSQYRTFSCC